MHSGTESFWAAISEALRKEGIVPEIQPPSRVQVLLALHDMSGVYQSDPAPLTPAQGSLLRLILSFTSGSWEHVCQNLWGGHPQCRLWPHQPCWPGSEDAGISRKFPDLSPLKEPCLDPKASVEPGLGPTVHCSLSPSTNPRSQA